MAGRIPLLLASKLKKSYSWNAGSLALPQDAVFSRSSAAQYTAAAQLVQTAAIDTPRFERDLATGQLLGLLMERGRTSRSPYSRDLTNAAWAQSGITPTKDATGVLGDANGATRLTATTSNGTILQSVSDASNRLRAFSFYVRRRTGTGDFAFTINNLGWTPVTVPAGGAWVRLGNVATYTNPQLGFRISNSGDEFDVDIVDCEDGGFRTSPIITLTTNFTRTVDRLYIPIEKIPGFSINGGTAVLKFNTISDVMPNQSFNGFLSVGDGTSNNRFDVSKRDFTASALASSVSGGVTVGSVGESSLNTVVAGYNTIAVTWQDGNKARLCFNGLNVVESSGSFNMPANITRIELGYNPTYTAGDVMLMGFDYYPQFVPGDVLKTLGSR